MKPLQPFFNTVLFVFSILRSEIWKFCQNLTLVTLCFWQGKGENIQPAGNVLTKRDNHTCKTRGCFDTSH